MWRHAAALVALVMTGLALSARYPARRGTPTVHAAAGAASCVPDFGACGGVLSPVRARCCNPQSTCFRRGRYFSQCRPKPSAASELGGGGGSGLIVSSAGQPGAAGGARAGAAAPQGTGGERVETVAEALCAPDFGVCAAGADASSALECCSKKSFNCRRSSPLFHQCLPEKSRLVRDPSGDTVLTGGRAGDGADYAWRVVALPRSRMAYMSAAQAAAMPALIAAEPLSAADKLGPVLDRLRAGVRPQDTVMLHCVVPTRIPELPVGVDALLADALPEGTTFRARSGEILVKVEASGRDSGREMVWEAAMVLASFPFVRDVQID